jgi:hypothetical protein
VNAVINLRVQYNAGNFLTNLGTVNLLRKDCCMELVAARPYLDPFLLYPWVRVCVCF